MEKDKITSEDKLLKIIENPSSEKEGVFSVFRKRNKARQRDKPKVESFWKKENITGLFKLRTINKLLIVLSAAMTIFLFVYLYYLKIKQDRKLSDIENMKGGFFIGKDGGVDLSVSLDESISEAVKRNIFTFIPPKEEIVGMPQVVSLEDVSKLIDGIKLVGIIWSETNPEIMIENEKEQKTHLLGEGEQYGGLKVKKIYRNKVLVEVEGNELELR